MKLQAAGYGTGLELSALCLLKTGGRKLGGQGRERLEQPRTLRGRAEFSVGWGCWNRGELMGVRCYLAGQRAQLAGL